MQGKIENYAKNGFIGVLWLNGCQLSTSRISDYLYNIPALKNDDESEMKFVFHFSLLTQGSFWTIWPVP